jgi:hypothetical protein
VSVQALTTDDGFAIPLPYGANTDWLKNVLAASSATLANDETTSRVDRLELVPIHVALQHFPQQYRWSLRLYGVDQFRQVRRMKPLETRAPTTEPG